MPLREDLIAPIPGDNPSGRSLRYDRVYDQIKEARTEEDDTLPAGAWERTAKRADFRVVVKLATDVLATKSKDLQIAAWLGEAHLKLEGPSQLPLILKLFLELQREFWDTIFPEIDEGDVGLRAVPLQWAANRYAGLVYELPLTKAGVNFIAYKAARALGTEADVAGNEARRNARAAAVAKGQITAEEVDVAIAATPKAFYATLEEYLRDAIDQLEELAIFCEERYGDDGPSYRKLRESLEEVHNLVGAQLNEKRRSEPDAVPAAETLVQPDPYPAPAIPAQAAVTAPTPAPVAAPVAPAAPLSAAPVAAAAIPTAAPQGWDAAAATLVACARAMASERPGSFVPYQIQTALQWGELRREGPKPPFPMREGPSPEDRAFLKQAAIENRWSDVLRRAMSLVGAPPGRAWLDLHRYIWAGAAGSGFGGFKDMVVRSVRELLVDYPDMDTWTLTDNLPAADPETMNWLATEVRPPAQEVEEAAPNQEVVQESAPPPPPVRPEVPPQVAAPPPPPPAPVPVVAAASRNGFHAAPELDTPQDNILGQAMLMAKAGQLREATRLLARDAAAQPAGRLRFRRRLELAQLCVDAQSSTVAVPVLRDLIAEIDDRKLETWEEFDMVTRPMALMLRCMDRPEQADERERLLARLSRIDPTAELEILS